MFNNILGDFNSNNIITEGLFDFNAILSSLVLQFLILTFILYNGLSNPLLNVTTEQNEDFVSIFKKVLPIYGFVGALVLLFVPPFW